MTPNWGRIILSLWCIVVFQVSIMCLTPASVERSACWRVRGSLWIVSVGNKRTAKPCPCWHPPAQVQQGRKKINLVCAQNSTNYVKVVVYSLLHKIQLTKITKNTCRMDLLCREDSRRLYSPVHQHHSLSTADDGLSGEKLFCRTAGMLWTRL